MITVKATREGLIGQRTASGYIVDRVVPFVALPAAKALGRMIRLTANGRHVYAVVLDIGPWYTDDDAYVFGQARPRAEAGWRPHGGPSETNGAGIDLGERVWRDLQMTDNGSVRLVVKGIR